jgi:hypothetical protein
MPYLRVLTQPVASSSPSAKAPRLSHYDDCVSCRAEPHGMHETKPNGAPIIICAGACKTPTRHRFSRLMESAGAATHLIWVCTACEGERVFGCVG